MADSNQLRRLYDEGFLVAHWYISSHHARSAFLRALTVIS